MSNLSVSPTVSTQLPSWQIQAKAELELRLRRRRLALADAPPPTFTAWLDDVSPEWSDHWRYRFLVFVREQLAAMWAGEFDRAMLFMPPRHFKSQMVTVRHSAYLLEMDPTIRIIVGSYNDDLATEFGRQIRAIVEPRVGLRRGAASVKNWKTNEGGGVLSVGVGSGVTGFGGDCVTGDTPIITDVGVVAISALFRLHYGCKVLSRDDETGALSYQPIVAKRSVIADELIEIETSGGRRIRCTPEHRLFVIQSGYREAGSIREGEGLIVIEDNVPCMLGDKMERGENAQATRQERVSMVRRVRTGGEPVYDIQVAENNNFFAGGILAHNCIMIDDPIKSREEANSLSFRDRNYNWFTNDIWTRREPGAKVWITQTRWHQDDLAGRILAEIPDGWRIFRLPAVAESQEVRDRWAAEHYQPLGLPDPIGRAEGEVLNPERFDSAWVQDQKNVLGFDFDSLLQQWPRLSSGGIFLEDWFVIVDSLPDYVKPKEYCRVWDTGATEDGGDYTVGVLMMRDRSSLYWVLDVVRGQWGVGKRDRMIEEVGRRDLARYGLRKLYVLEEPGSSGKSVSHNLQKQMPDLRVVGKRETGSKVTRAEPLAGGLENGLVRFLRVSGYNALKTELVSFPEGAHDDQVDPLAMAYLLLARRSLSSSKTRTLRGGI